MRNWFLITYVWTAEGWLYLAVVMDLYSRMVVGWAMSKRVMDALQMAIWRRKKPLDVIIHSDRSSQCDPHDYQKLIAENGFICSMSMKGDCFDSASMESWNHSFKVEAIHGEKFQRELMQKAKCLNASMCITIENIFILNLAT